MTSSNIEPCEPCRLNGNPNCGNDWCHTRSTNEKKEWIVDCGACGSKNEVTWKQAINDGCSVCCSYKVSIYNRKSLQKE